MIAQLVPECGTLFLILSLVFSGFVLISTKSTKFYVVGQSICVALAYLCLTTCFLLDEFSVRYVLLNSSTSLPWMYKLCAVWGGHEGSMLLWVFILNLWMCAITFLSQSLEPAFYHRVLKILSLLNVGFVLFLLCTSNPFIRQFEVLNSTGRDLNPLLQDPGFLFHPPMLYMGYVGFSVAFALAIAALWLGRVEKAWASWARPWTIAAWSCLTLGITLGSWWAYRELGWGGWWFWDPVENASFMPWLVGTALIHAIFVCEKQGSFKAWTVLLAIIAFSLSLIGTFLVRSGVLTSVHAFAVDPTRGLYILIFLLLVVGGALGLFAFRFDTIKETQKPFLVSRVGSMLFNNVLLTVSMLTVLLGTVYPLFIDALQLGKLSVGAPYFNAVFVPLMLPVLALMGFGIHANWQKDNISALFLRLKTMLGASFLLAIGIFFYFKIAFKLFVFLGLWVGFWVVMTTLKSFFHKLKLQGSRQISPRFLGMCVAHIGVGVVALGISLSAGFGIEEEMKLSLGESTSFAGYQMKLVSVERLRGANFDSTKVCFSLIKPEQAKPIVLCPEKRFYDVSQMVMTEADIYVSSLSDLYIALGEPISQHTWTLRALYKPGVRWIWGGGFLILLGGVLALIRKNPLKVGKKR